MKIELRGVTKSFGKRRALDGVSLEIGAGQIVAVLGPNGAGKTTALRCLYGLAAPEKGLILYDDEEFSRDRLDLRRRLFFLPDFPLIFAHMTLVQHIGMMVNVYQAEKDGTKDRVLRAIRDLDLIPLAEAPLGLLSRGQIYKAALAAMIAVDPDVWLLDEPFASGMDPHGISAFKKYAREAADRGKCIIYSTQILEVVERFSDRVCVIQYGELRAFDSVANLKAQFTGSGGVLENLFQQLREEAMP